LILAVACVFIPTTGHAKKKPKKVVCDGRCMAIVDIALTKCRNAPKTTKKGFLVDLIKVEISLGVPEKYRGMVLAAACRESGYRAKPRRGDDGKAVGLLQMWPWWEKRFGIKRTDPKAAARAWIKQILNTVKKARRRCGKKMAFRSAWAWVASGPKRWRCRSPRHYRLLRRWHRKALWPSTKHDTSS